MDDNMIWLLCFLGLMLTTAVALLCVLIRDETALSKRVAKHDAEMDEVFQRLGRLEQAANASSALRQHLNAQARMGMLGLGKADEGKPQ